MWYCFLGGLQTPRNEVDSRGVAKDSQSTYNAHCLVTEIAVMSPAFPSMDIGHVKLQERQFRRQKRISQRHAGVSEASRVDDYKVALAASFMKSINNGSLVV